MQATSILGLHVESCKDMAKKSLGESGAAASPNTSRAITYGALLVKFGPMLQTYRQAELVGPIGGHGWSNPMFKPGSALSQPSICPIY